MTDEMMIEQRRSPLAPTLIGLTAGGGAGYLTGHLMTKPMSYEDIIKEVNENDKFEARTKEGAKDASTWQDVKKKADEVAKLKNELADVEKGELKDPDLKRKLDNAKNEYENAIKKLTEGKTEVRTTGASFIRQAALERTDGITAADVKSIENELGQYYNAVENLRAKTINHSGNLVVNSNHALETELENYNNVRKNAITNMYGKNKNAGNNAKAYIEKLLPKNPRDMMNAKDFSNIKYLSEAFGEDIIKIHDSKFQGSKNIGSYSIEDAFGKGRKAWVEINFEAYNSLRSSLIETAKSNTMDYRVLINSLTDINTEFFNANKDALSKFEVNSVNDLDKFNLKDSKAFKNDLDLLKANIENAKINNKSFVSDIPSQFRNNGNSAIMSIKDAEILLESQTRKYDLMFELGEKQAPIKAKQTAIISDDPFVRKAKAQYQKAHSENKAVEDAINNIKKKLTGNNTSDADKELWSKLESILRSEGDTSSKTVPGLSREEAIEKLAKERPELKKAIEDAEKAAEGAERTAANPNKVSAAKKAVEDGEKSLREMAESLGKKMTKGPNKWLTAGIGAAAVGITTLLAVSSRNNKTQA